MADFSSLKQTIQTYIKQNGNEEITGNILQDVLLAMVSTMGDSAINTLASALQDETTARQNQDGTLQGNITAEATARQQADTAFGGRIDGLQTAINGINTKLAEGYIYAGIATPSTNPGTPSGKVFYIAVSSGTYTNFSNLTAEQGINILKYNGSAWSKDVVYAIDARPKKNSQNLVTSGGVFDNMGALDVSELNATENPHTLALYADLSAALAAIPTDYQKGGMSIKFVHDNKYVQYRYMEMDATTASVFTNTANWQAVASMKDIASIIPLNSANKENYYINSNNVVASYPTVYVSILLPFTGRHIINAKSELNCKVYCLTDLPVLGQSAPLCSGTSGVNIIDGAQIIIPTDIKYISINVPIGATITSFVVDGVYDLVNGIADLAQKAKINPYFIDPIDATNRVMELYLTGLDMTKQYHISQLGLEGNGYMRMTLVDSNGNEVARTRETTNTKGVVKVLERNSSGIKGYAILDIKDNDSYNRLYSGTINNKIVSNIDYSPAIKAYIASGDNVIKMDSLYGADFVNLYDNIVWNQGAYLYIYHFGQDDGDSLRGCRVNTDANYDYAAPFFMKKGDIIEWTSPINLNTNASTAAVCVTDENGHTYNSILNLYGLPSEERNHYRWVADRDMWVSCNVRSNANNADTFHWYRSKVVADVVDNIHQRSLLFPSNEIVDLLEQCNKKEQRYDGGADIPQLVLIHFSDIHNDFVRFNRILQFRKKFNRYIDDIILTGDLCGKYFNYDLAIKDLDGYEDVLIAIGNHDVYDVNNKGGEHYSDPEYWADAEQKYKLWMMGKTPVRDNDPESPTYQDIVGFDGDNDNIANWGVVQPAGIGVGDYYPCYYYKDYADEKVRMIVLDEMDFDQVGSRVQSAAELAWFQQVLDDTLNPNNAAYGYHVLISGHFAPRTSLESTIYMDTGFNCLNDPTFHNIGNNITSYVAKVDTFINNGGHFICWLCGHFHWDQVATMTNHPKQLYIAIASGSISEWMEHRARVLNQESEDLFNLVAIDTYNKHIRVARIGSKLDRYLQHAGTMCISYDSTGDKTPHLLCTY